MLYNSSNKNNSCVLFTTLIGFKLHTILHTPNDGDSAETGSKLYAILYQGSGEGGRNIETHKLF